MNPPVQEKVTDQSGKLTISWIDFISQLFLTANSLLESGTTAQRPTKNLWIGRMYFDTSLAANGKPIWVDKNGTGWVDGSGASV